MQVEIEVLVDGDSRGLNCLFKSNSGQLLYGLNPTITPDSELGNSFKKKLSCLLKMSEETYTLWAVDTQLDLKSEKSLSIKNS